MATNEFKKRISSMLSNKAKDLGFIKKKGLCSVPLNNEIRGTLFFSIYSKYNHYLVDAVIGVRVESLEQLALDLNEGRGGFYDKKFAAPSMSIQLGYLMPGKDYKEWDFYDGVDIQALIDDWGDSIKTYGFAYYRKYNSIDAVFEFFLSKTQDPKFTCSQYYEKYLAMLYYLKGEKEKGLKFLDETIHKYDIAPKEKYLTVTDHETGEVTKYDIEKLSEEEYWKILRTSVGVTISSSCTDEISPDYWRFINNYRKL